MATQKINFCFIKVSLLIVIMAFVLSSHVYAATITVKQLGGGDYTTISAAINNAQLDDTIMVYHGRYEEAVIVNKDLTLIGAGPDVTTIYSPSEGIKINNNIKATIIGFTITASKDGIYSGANSDIIVRNNCIVSNGGYGIRIYSNYATSKATIVNNTVFSNSSTGIFSRNTSGKAIISIINNIIYNNGKCGIDFYGTSYINISYNNVSGNAVGNYCSVSAGTGDISQNPLFIDFSNGNFALQSTSPSIDTGRPGSADADPDGTRNDMGAYGGSDAASFWPYPPGAPIITNLTATPTVVPQGGTITINATGELR